METINKANYNEWQAREAKRCESLGYTPEVTTYSLEPNELLEFVQSKEITNVKVRSKGDVYGTALFCSIRNTYAGTVVDERCHPQEARQ